MDDKDKKIISTLASTLDHLYKNPFKLYGRQFALGIFYGLGATVGAAIVLAILGFILRSLGGLPVVGDWINGWSNSLNSF